jgi:RHH-type transcriptional regulator, proline utilization regulon repressor / proline dehydrogenase / delta 1-pyrroline-5-carboxylate dehydrogenase
MPQRLPSPYRDESAVVANNLARLKNVLDWQLVPPLASPWVQAVRLNPPPFWAMESLLKEYPISSNEGLALMRLAEALLRIPDAQTAIALTADQLGRADFSKTSDSSLSRLSNAAIAMSKHFLPGDEAGSTGLLGKLGARTIVAATLRAVQLLGRQFVMGQTIDEALHVASKSGAKLTYSYDMLGEGARTQADAQRYFESYRNAITSIAAHPRNAQGPTQSDGISIKLSALHPRFEHTQHVRVMHELVPRVWQLCELAARANINLTIDAEEVERLELSLDVFEALLALMAKEHPNWQGFGLALQAYQTRSMELIEHVGNLARQYKVKLMCRLVKGAYWDAEIKRAQELGMPYYPVFTHKHHTDVSYLACASTMLANSDAIYPQFATHNAGTIAAIIQMATKTGSAFELQRLHGMGEGVYREVLTDPSIRCRVYAPVGAHRDLLAYLVRRLLENGANSSFVHQLADESVNMDQLLTSPLHLETQESLPNPQALYGTKRKNSRGIDLADETQAQPLFNAMPHTRVPVVPEFSPKQAPAALVASKLALPQWRDMPVQLRALILNSAADKLEDQMPKYCALLVLEAHKTWGDAIAEVREAVDFLRYYALQSVSLMQPIAMPGPTGETNTLSLTARGVWVCISPWNFPLAIFIGQVAAALVTGNTVLAKPAEQTPGIAQEAVALLHAAGVPSAALVLCHGPGNTLGAALVGLDGIAGVVFTGSTNVAKIINRALAAKEGPITPFIAETGGINAMVVDSSALPEQVCDAVVQSAFRSAGQRCSALRLLCLDEGIADAVIDMICGATQELQIGETQAINTDLGPVIDEEAFRVVRAHVHRLGLSHKALVSHEAWQGRAGNYVAPQLYEVNSVSEVREEIFGPVLQVVRYRGDPAAVVEQINQLGFGLTLGIHTRIDNRALALAQSAQVGNVYINRNIIGAVVGTQPFGGEGLSGTGPKAGGPHYLLRFCTERTLTINTAAAGGNAELLASKPLS